ncbi:MAG: 50S ribosomal protein L11 methyltransferase [Actinobacteria bacterium]|nr:50S ribosomal protein L11 methyltransferase [Actinomycetota bacterium]
MIRLAVRVDRRRSELVLAELLELAPGGVEEVAVGTEIVEYAVYGAPGELPTVPALKAAAGGALVDVRTTEIADDWAERWRAFHRPLVLGDRLTVRPPWEPPGETALDVAIDPGQAFGTGAHATTRLCLELMLESSVGQGSFVDVGCGSGVLAILAAKLGFDPVIALDYDPAAVTATKENARRNGVTLTALRFDVRREQVPDSELVVANVLAGPLVAWAAHQRRLPAQLILSGILTAEADRVAGAFVARGLTAVSRRELGEWSALALTGAAGLSSVGTDERHRTAASRHDDRHESG